MSATILLIHVQTCFFKSLKYIFDNSLIYNVRIITCFSENDDGPPDLFVDHEAQGAICDRDAGAIFDTSYYSCEKHHCFWGCISCSLGET